MRIVPNEGDTVPVVQIIGSRARLMLDMGVLLIILLGSSPERKGLEGNLTVLFLYMDVRLSDGYHWQRPKLEEKCKQWDLSTEESLRELRKLLTSYTRSCLKGEMDTKVVSFVGGSSEERGNS